MRPSTPEAPAVLLPPPPLRLLPGGAIQFPGGSFIPLWTSAFHGALKSPDFVSYGRKMKNNASAVSNGSRSMLPSKSWLLRIQQALLSLNLAWILVWHEHVHPKPPSSIAYFLYTHIRLIEPDIVLEQICWSLIVGACLFLLLCLLSQSQAIQALMRALGGAVSIAGFPVFVVTFPVLFFYTSRIEAYAPTLVLETLAVLLCGGLYYVRKWPVPTALSLVLLLLHFSLWAWVSGCWVSPTQEVRVYGLRSLGIWISTAFYLGFPVLGFLSTLSWALNNRSATR